MFPFIWRQLPLDVEPSEHNQKLCICWALILNSPACPDLSPNLPQNNPPSRSAPAQCSHAGWVLVCVCVWEDPGRPAWEMDRSTQADHTFSPSHMLDLDLYFSFSFSLSLSLFHSLSSLCLPQLLILSSFFPFCLSSFLSIFLAFSLFCLFLFLFFCHCFPPFLFLFISLSLSLSRSPPVSSL